MSLKLVVGNKNYSSWSMRPWIAMKALGIAFDEIVIPLYVPGSKEEILKYSPSGKVPFLLDGATGVWDSLAIIEYLSEKFPAAGFWPSDPIARARARSISAEMHSGFGALRSECGMNMHRVPKALTPSDACLADVARIQAIWSDCRGRNGGGGPFLFGKFSGADAMYAPVVSRFLSYGIDVTPASRAYMDAMTSHSAWREWETAARAEPWVIEKFEV